MIEQIFIAVFGFGGVYLSQQSNKNLQRYASILGLIGQPFWFYAMYKSQQWGVFLLCFAYTYAWALGFYNNWMKK